MRGKPWVAMFSQTGSEIIAVSKKLNKFPDVILTNRAVSSIDEINQELLDKCYTNILFIPNKPTTDEYMFAIPWDSIVTLHGYLRIIPSKVCTYRTIFNSHPANLIQNPELKGIHPQKRAYSMGLTFSGNTIHECVKEVDAGKILVASSVNIAKLSESEIIKKLHTDSIKQWSLFLRYTLKK